MLFYRLIHNVYNNLKWILNILIYMMKHNNDMIRFSFNYLITINLNFACCCLSLLLKHQMLLTNSGSLIENDPTYKLRYNFSSGHPSKLITAINVIALDDRMETIYSSLQRSLVNNITIIIIINQH